MNNTVTTKLIIIAGIFAIAIRISINANAGFNQPRFQTSAKTGAEIYDQQCAVCHGNDGKAQTVQGKKMHARDFTNSGWQARTSDDRIIKTITKGKEKMPAFGQKLSADEIKSLVQVVRGFKGA